LKPWLTRQWCLPPKANDEFVCAMEDVLEVYKRPYSEANPVVCMDESSKQLIEETRMPEPVKPGQPQKVDYEYQRNGVAHLFMFFAPLSGWRHVEVTDHHAKIDWAHCMKDLVDVHFPHAEKITVVMDNLNTHRAASLYAAFPPQEARRLLSRLELHYTPKHGSWLNMAEMEFSVLMRQCLDRRIPDKDTIKREVAAWEATRNMKSSPVNWRFTVQDARVKLKKLYPVILN